MYMLSQGADVNCVFFFLMSYFSKPRDYCVLIYVNMLFFVQFVWDTWVCGESWLAIKDSLTHRPSSQGWASKCPLCIYLYILVW